MEGEQAFCCASLCDPGLSLCSELLYGQSAVVVLHTRVKPHVAEVKGQTMCFQLSDCVKLLLRTISPISLSDRTILNHITGMPTTLMLEFEARDG